jgi:hypothetical protein
MSPDAHRYSLSFLLREPLQMSSRGHLRESFYSDIACNEEKTADSSIRYQEAMRLAMVPAILALAVFLAHSVGHPPQTLFKDKCRM